MSNALGEDGSRGSPTPASVGRVPLGEVDQVTASRPPELNPDPGLDLDSDRTATPLVPHFPGPERRTGVILVDGSRGALGAHWCLEPNDLRRAVGNFPGEGGGPQPVLRLHRTHSGSGAELVDEVGLTGVVREGVGETQFQVAADHGRYVAELGLTNAGGGWLMLARSNELDNVSPVGIDLSGLAAAPRTAPALLPLGHSEPALSSPTPEIPERLGDAFPVAVVPIVPPAGPSPAPPGPLSAPTDAPVPRVQGPLAPRVAAAPVAGPPQVRWGSAAATLTGSFPPVSPGDSAGPEAPTPLFGAGAGQSELPGRPVRLEPPPFADDSLGKTGALLADRNQVGANPGSPGTPLVYGQPPTRVTGLQLAAELRITGQAAPGTLIDLFGHPFRVGPGGRFQLVLRVDDAALLRRALELHPPPELTRPRED